MTGCTQTQRFTGIVVAVDGPSLVDVRSATVRAADGRSLTFDVTRLDVANGLPAAHLREHLATSAPIVVDYVVEGGQSVAMRYNDAP